MVLLLTYNPSTLGIESRGSVLGYKTLSQKQGACEKPQRVMGTTEESHKLTSDLHSVLAMAHTK